MSATVPEIAVKGAEQGLPRETRVALVTNFAAHYRVKLFEELARMCELDCYFYSDGGEWYWERSLGVRGGKFRFEYLPGFWLGQVRICPRLVSALLKSRHDVIIKCINDRFAVPVTYLAARLRGVPFVLWSGVWCRLTGPLQRLLFPLTRHLYRSADAVVAYGEHVRRYLISEGVDPNRIFLAPQAVDNASYQTAVPEITRSSVRRSLGITEGRKILLYIGRLEAIKGLEFLLDACAISGREAVLVICGCGSLAAALRMRADRLRITDRIRFRGYVPPEDTVFLYSVAWTVVLPSISTPGGRETWGLVANEAFNQGVPVIASDVVGAVAGGLVRHSETGLVVPERNTEALAAAIDRMLEEPGLRHRLGENARAEIAGWTQIRMAKGFRDAAWFAVTHREIP